MNSSTESLSSDPSLRRATSAEAFEFVRELASELSSNTIELPSYPDVAAKVQRVVADENASIERVIQAIGAEPVLASRVLTIANSAALNPAGKPVSDLRSAVARLGFDALRTAAVGFAMAQLRKVQAFKGIERFLTALWQQSIWMAALSRALARQGGRFAPDTAMLAGLVHGVGKLYILTRATRHPALCADQRVYQTIVRDWHANIAKALLENWKMPEEIVSAVHGFEEAADEQRTVPMLADLLATAQILMSFKDSPDLLEERLSHCAAAMRLNIDRAACERLLSESAAEIEALRAALG